MYLPIDPLSAGQSDKALLARLHTLEQEKLMLTEQVESAQAMMRSYLEAEQLRSPQHTNTDSDQAQVNKQLHQIFLVYLLICITQMQLRFCTPI